METGGGWIYDRGGYYCYFFVQWFLFSGYLIGREWCKSVPKRGEGNNTLFVLSMAGWVLGYRAGECEGGDSGFVGSWGGFILILSNRRG